MIIRSVRTIAWLYAVAIAFLTLTSPDLRPETAVPHDFEHLVAFWVLGFLFSIGYQSRSLLLLLVGTIFIAALEALQIWVPNRHARWIDLFMNMSGFCAGLVIGLAVLRSVGHLFARYSRVRAAVGSQPRRPDFDREAM